MNRRQFLAHSLAGSAALFGAWQPSTALANVLFANPEKDPLAIRLKKLVREPVIIDSIELVRVRDLLFVVTKTKDGIVGVVETNSRMENMLTLFKNQVADFFVGKDARDIITLLDQVYLFRRNYKYAGMPLWNCVAHVELGIFDILGRVAKRPVDKLVSDRTKKSIPVYMSSTRRDTTAEQEVAWVGERIADTGAKAAKLKIGGRMSKNQDVYPGRTEDLIKLSRKNWGDDFVLYFDANGSYDVAKAVQIGKLLEAHDVAFYEEPVPWEDFDRTKQVADKLDIMVAGGEQDHSMPKWEWMINQRAVDLAQPDIMYNGGFFRTLQVARLAAAVGMDCTLHSPKNNALGAYMLHFASAIDNCGSYQEWRADLPKDGSHYSPNLVVKQGAVAVPEGHGFGIDFDMEFLEKGKVLKRSTAQASRP